MRKIQILVVGGGAAGFFAALSAKKQAGNTSVAILEKTKGILGKVKISGGGRCNLTHACFEPSLLVTNYPRGSKELLGPFFRFQPKDTMEWFESRGVPLKIEEDGRVFPQSDSSDDVIRCLFNETKKAGIEILNSRSIVKIDPLSPFHVHLNDGECLEADKLILATGSNPEGHRFAEKLGHTLQPPVPSLFTFNIPNSPIKPLAGISVDRVKTRLPEAHLETTGSLLITHWGFSGPAALKLSAFGARFLHQKNYHTPLHIDWTPELAQTMFLHQLVAFKKHSPNKTLLNFPERPLPRQLWNFLIEKASLDPHARTAEISQKSLERFTNLLKEDVYLIEGKTTHKEEFVTCGGVTLNEVNFKTMESKICPGLYFSGEILDIDGVTGGFNFQNAWTTGWIAGLSAAKTLT